LASQAERLLEMHQKDFQLKENQKALQQQSRRLLDIIEATEVATWEWNVQTGEIRVNDRWAEMLGYTKAELKPLNIDTWYRVVHPEDRGKSDEELQACMDGDLAFYDIECRLVHKDGHVVWVNDRGKVIERSTDGQVLWMAGTHTDITERKENEAQLATITNNIPGVVFRYKLYPDGTDMLMKVSEGAMDLWGVSAEEAMQNNQLVWQRYDDRDLRGHLQSIRESADDLSHWEHEWRYQHPDGTLRWHKGAGNPIREEDGSVVWDSLILDITDRKLAELDKAKAEALLVERNQEWQRMFEYSLDMISTLDAQGYFKSINPASLAILGYQPDEMIGKHVSLFITEEDEPLILDASKEVMVTTELRDLEIRYVHKLGHMVPVLWNVRWDADRKELHCIGRDDSERQKALSEISLLINNTEEAFILMNRDLRITIFNDQFGRLYETYFGRKVHRGDHILDYAQPERREALEDIYRKVLNGQKHTAEFTIPREQEVDLVVALTYHPARDKHGEIFGAFVAITDITERKQAEEKLTLSEKRFRSLVENNGDAMAIINTDGQLAYVSPSVKTVLGYTADEALQMNLFHEVHPEDQNNVSAKMEEVLKNPGVPIPGTISRIRHKDGSWRWLDATLTNMLDDPAVGGIVDNFRDVTQQKNEQLRQNLLAEISQFFMVNEELKPTLRQVLFHLVSIGSFDLSEIWLASRDQTQLNLVTHYPQSHLTKKFYKKSSQAFFKLGEGLPGEVWETKQSGLYEELSAHPSFIRKQGALSAGLQSALAVPLIHNDQVIGVLLCASLSKSEELKPYQEVLTGISSYLAAEIDRKQLQDEMHLLFASAPDILAIAAPTGYFTKVNPAFCELLGYSEEELLTKPYDHLIHPEDRENSQEEFAETITGQRRADNYINRLQTKGGEYRWISWNSSEVFSDEGLVFSYGRDITEIKKLQNLLDNASQLSRLGGWEVDLIDGKVFLSDVTRAIHELESGYEPDLESAIHFYREDVRPVIREHVEKLIASGEGFDLELPIITAKGNERWIRTIGRAEMVKGVCMRIHGSFQDIHDRKTAEIRLQNTSDNIPGVIYQYVLHPDGTDEILHLTKGAKDLWKHDAAQCMAEPDVIWDQIKAGGDYEKLQKSIVESAETHAPWHCQYRSRQPDGKVIWLEGHGSPRPLPDGSVLWDCIVIDSTEKKELEELLEQSSEMAKMGSWEIDLRTEQVYWSSMTCRIHEVEEEFSPTIEEAVLFYREDIRTKVQHLVQDCMATGVPVSFEYPIVTAKGKERWVRVLADTEVHQGDVIRVFGSIQDIQDRKIAELDLARFKQVIENSQDAIAMAGPDLKTIYMNPAMQDILGISDYIQEELGGPTSVYADPKLADKVFSTLKTGAYWKGDVQIMGQKGEVIDFHLSAGPVLSEQGELMALYGIHTDITERKKAEKALEDAFREKHQILESIGDAFFSVTKDFKVTYWNRMAERLLQVSRERIIGQQLWDVFDDAVNSTSYEHYHQAIRNQETINFEDYYASVNRWFEVSAYPSQKGLTVYFKDVTERKQAIEEIRAANERFVKVSEATNDAIWDWDIANGTIHWGIGFEKLFGYDLKKFKPSLEAWGAHVHPEDSESVRYSLDALLANPEEDHWQFEYRYQKTTGEYLYVLDKGIVTRTPSGEAVRMVGAVIDITHHKEYEQSLKELNTQLEERARALAISNEELEQFAYVASHDLQEPLRMVTSFLTQLNKKYRNELDDKAHQYIDFAVDGAKRMRQVILDLLEYSRVGREEDQLVELPLNMVVADVSRLLHREIERSGAKIHFHDLPVVNNYKTPLIQIFQNLISNAIKYTAATVSPDITITAERKNNEWLIAVRDNGIGIEAEYFDKIFIIFQRLHGRKEYSGTGMGLALVKKNVEVLGGRIWLESSPGQGSTFYFTLPEM
jgi:PAS domain S-box-containing protein